MRIIQLSPQRSLSHLRVDYSEGEKDGREIKDSRDGEERREMREERREMREERKREERKREREMRDER